MTGARRVAPVVWERRGGILVERGRRRPTLVVVRRRGGLFDFTKLVACPTCRARMTEHCRTDEGLVRGDHKTRLVRRVCSCGGRLLAKRDYCLECRKVRDRVRPRRHGAGCACCAYARRRRAGRGWPDR